MTDDPVDTVHIDRLAPTLRPAGRSVMRHRWAELLFLHWAVPPDQLRPLLPPGLDLDLFEGRAYVGLIPFTMTGIRPTWGPAFPPLSDFHEINLRTYVHCGGRDPGVWFFSLDAANPVGVRIARALCPRGTRLRLPARDRPPGQSLGRVLPAVYRACLIYWYAGRAHCPLHDPL